MNGREGSAQRKSRMHSALTGVKNAVRAFVTPRIDATAVLAKTAAFVT
jgi:hypothetical protein